MKKARFVVGGVVFTAMVIVGAGALRFKNHRDARPSRDDVETAETGPRASAPRVARDNANMRSVIEARQNHNHPERLSPLIAPRPFDPSAWASNPQAYLDVVEPGRCFRTATQVTPDTPRLKAGGRHMLRGMRGTDVPLLVQGAPNAPVTFTAFAGGSFTENGLNSISVRSDARGYAVVHFTTPENARGTLAVLVGSPMSVGNIRYTIQPS